MKDMPYIAVVFSSDGNLCPTFHKVGKGPVVVDPLRQQNLLEQTHVFGKVSPVLIELQLRHHGS